MQVVLGLIPGGNQTFLILYCKKKKKKACERERIYTSNEYLNYLNQSVQGQVPQGEYVQGGPIA